MPRTKYLPDIAWVSRRAQQSPPMVAFTGGVLVCRTSAVSEPGQPYPKTKTPKRLPLSPVRVRCDALVLNFFMNENKLGGLVRTFGTAEIVEVKIFDQGVLVTLRERSNAMYATNPPRPMPDKVWREIFRYDSGELRKVETQDGVHRPQTFMPEEIVFENVTAHPRE